MNFCYAFGVVDRGLIGGSCRYMPALVAMRFNPDLKAKYHDPRAAGKAGKVAITALMRKRVELANALIRNNRKWTPKPT